MGNKFSRKRPQIDDRYTRPQGLYQHKDVDQKKLKRLIMDSKLAPCYPGAEDAAIDLDECPICFLHYPSLNRSKCCTKGICTECFLQVKSPHTARPTQCPFCKTPSYAVEYRGAKTQEEKGVEQAEEQKVIEAKIRIRRQQELQDEEARLQRLEQVTEGGPTSRSTAEEADLSIPPTPAFPVFAGPTTVEERSSDRMTAADRSWHNWTSVDRGAIGYPPPPPNFFSFPSTNDSESTWFPGGQRDTDADNGGGRSSAAASRGLIASRGLRRRAIWSNSSSSDFSAQGQGASESQSNRNRDEEFDLDLEEIMLMEAIWLSIQQEQGLQRPTENSSESSFPSPYTGPEYDTQEQQIAESNESRGRSGGSVTSGFASAIAALAERQVAGGSPSLQQPGQAEVPEESASTSIQQANIQAGADRLLLKAQKIMNPGGDVENLQEPGSVVASNLSRWMRESSPEVAIDQGSETVEVGTSLCSSLPSASELPWEASEAVEGATEEAAEDGGHGVGSTTLEAGVAAAAAAAIPESFEEQMMLAMALSLAEAQRNQQQAAAAASAASAASATTGHDEG